MVTRLYVVTDVMVVVLFTLRYGILTMDATRPFNSTVAIVEDVELWYVTDVAVMGISLSTISHPSRVIVRYCMTQAESALIVHLSLIEDMTMVTMAILLALISA